MDQEVMYYYGRKDVRFRLISYTQNRELAFISKIRPESSTRNLKCHNIQQVLLLMQYLKFHQKDYSMYYSLARFREPLPWSGDDMVKRKPKVNEWVKKFQDNVVGMDFALDIDSPSHKDGDMNSAFLSTRIIKKYLDSVRCPYSLRFSGMGFHIIIASDYFKGFIRPFDIFLYLDLFHGLAKYLYLRFSEMVDVNIYDSRRVIKIPYSVAIYDDGEFICTPFNSTPSFEMFDLRRFRFSNMKSEFLKVRTEHIFNRDGSVQGLLDDVMNKRCIS